MEPGNRHSKIWQTALVGALLTAGVLVAVFHREIPAWTLSGTKSVKVALVGDDAEISLCPASGQTIELRGDSIVIGSRMGHKGVKGQPYGVVLAHRLGEDVTVRLHGRGGATALDGLRFARANRTHSQIVLLAYGTNDAAARGLLSGSPAVPAQSFQRSLLGHIAEAQKNGARVGLLAPPPVGSSAMAERVQPYRLAVQQVGRKAGVPVFDPAEAFQECVRDEPLLSWDALHPDQAGHTCMGHWLARELCR